MQMRMRLDGYQKKWVDRKKVIGVEWWWKKSIIFDAISKILNNFLILFEAFINALILVMLLFEAKVSPLYILGIFCYNMF